MEKCENANAIAGGSQNPSEEFLDNAPTTQSTMPNEGAGAKLSTWAVVKRHRVAVLWSAFIAIAAINWGMDALVSDNLQSRLCFHEAGKKN